MAGALLDAIDPDRIEAEALARYGHSGNKAQTDAAAALKEVACAPFANPGLRQLLVSIKARAEMVIDEVTQDRATYAGYDIERAKEIVQKFKNFVASNRDRLTALRIILGQPYGRRRLTYEAIAELADALERPPTLLTTAAVWQAYRRLEQAKVRGTTDPAKLLTNIVSLVRFASGLDEALESFDVGVTQRFNLWIGRQKKAGKEFTEEQMGWLTLVRDHIAANVEVTRRDLLEVPHFAERGGLARAQSLFGKELEPVLEDLNGTLVA
jgi:type I restriction enzyme R subunit